MTGERKEPEKIVVRSRVFANTKPAGRLLTFWSWCPECPTGTLPGGQGPCKRGGRGAAGRAYRPAHRDRPEPERPPSDAQLLLSFPSAAPHASENKLANGEPFISFILGPDPIK